MTHRTGFDDGRRGARLRATRGDGSPLASFLCPICHHDVLVEEVACDHLLLVRDRFGEVYCRDRRVRELHREVERELGERGERAIERVCERLGPTVVLYELLDPPRAQSRWASTLFVVDVGESRASAGTVSPG